jgi:hypothetical protein
MLSLFSLCGVYTDPVLHENSDSFMWQLAILGGNVGIIFYESVSTQNHILVQFYALARLILMYT